MGTRGGEQGSRDSIPYMKKPYEDLLVRTSHVLLNPKLGTKHELPLHKSLVREALQVPKQYELLLFLFITIHN